MNTHGIPVYELFLNQEHALIGNFCICIGMQSAVLVGLIAKCAYPLCYFITFVFLRLLHPLLFIYKWI
jgi:hypothetical protein